MCQEHQTVMLHTLSLILVALIQNCQRRQQKKWERAYQCDSEAKGFHPAISAAAETPPERQVNWGGGRATTRPQKTRAFKGRAGGAQWPADGHSTMAEGLGRSKAGQEGRSQTKEALHVLTFYLSGNEEPLSHSERKNRWSQERLLWWSPALSRLPGYTEDGR